MRYYEADSLFTSDDSWFKVLVGVNVHLVVDDFMEHDDTGLSSAFSEVHPAIEFHNM